MLKHPELIEELERRFISEEGLSYRKALRIFEAMWDEAVKLGAIPPHDPYEGLEVDIKIAGILNSCSKKSSHD